MPQQRRGASAAGPPATLSGRIERLFEVHRPPDAPQRRWRNNEIVAACKATGREFSESHLSELRRGIKRNPTMRTLEALAWFFDVRVGYFTDPAVAAEVELDLAARKAELDARLRADREAHEDAVAAARELQEAMRVSGVTKMAHRATDANDHRERAAMMRALARALVDEAEDQGPEDQD